MKSNEGIFVGYADNSKGFRIFNPDSGDVIITRDVVIVDEGRPAKFLRKQELVEFTELFSWVETTEDNLQAGSPPRVQEEEAMVPVDQANENVTNQTNIFDRSSDNVVPALALPPQLTRPADEQQGLRRSGRERVFPGKYSDFVCFSSTAVQNFSEQFNFDDTSA